MELNKAATGEVWFDPIFPKTDGVDVGTVVFSPNGRTVWHQHEHGQLLQITSGYSFVSKDGDVHSGCAPATRYGSRPTSGGAQVITHRFGIGLPVKVIAQRP
jgi:hypothetical protein